MVLTFIIATIIFLFALWLGGILISMLFVWSEIRIRNRVINKKKKRILFFASITTLTILSVYFCLFLVTKLTKYFYDYNNREKVFIGCVIPILLGISMVKSTRKYASQVSEKEYRAYRNPADVNDKLSYEIQKIKDNFFGVGIGAGLIIFIAYYISPSFFNFALKLFFIS